MIDRGGHFIDRRGGLVGLALLAQHAMAHVIHARGQAGGAGIKLRSGARHGIDHTVVGGLHGVEGAGHLADFIAAGQRHPGREITGLLHVQHDVFEGVELAE
ncbi:hypothetical protein D3C78_709850 [compost metagenome]